MCIPALLDLYENNEIEKYLKELDGIEEPDTPNVLTKDEKVLMKILKELVTCNHKLIIRSSLILRLKRITNCQIKNKIIFSPLAASKINFIFVHLANL